ncbi:hypothetical protein AX14_002657 [Amanita brunnescens Koide BX004]|nr:hypothetical protein AX14_002657 [Amanita brunnescens Koide BX004]
MTQESYDPGFTYSLLKTLKTPSAVSSLAFGHAAQLFVGTHDGTLRVYDLSTFKVIKAVRNLGSEVSSIICVKRPGSDLRDAWIAAGTKIMKFQLDSPKMIQDVHDALEVIDLVAQPDDLVNEIGLNGNKTHIVFSTDAGIVGVVDLTTKEILRMKTEHGNVCGCVKFIPTKPKELVSGGYDQKLLHFDYTNGNLLSEREIAPYAPVGGMSLSPPFIMSMAMSATGILTAGAADGRLWINFAGETSKEGKKNRKIWNGLDESKEHVIKIAEGPIVAMAFINTQTLIVSSLMGVIIQYRLVLEKENELKLEKLWERDGGEPIKVNVVVVDEKRVVIGGLQPDGTGVIEIWQKE